METGVTVLLLSSPSTNCDSSATMAPERDKMNPTSQTMRCSLICCSLITTDAPTARLVFSASTRWTVEIEVDLSNHASILSVTVAGLNAWKKGKGRIVCFVQGAIHRQTLLLMPGLRSSLVRQTKLRPLTHPN